MATNSSKAKQKKQKNQWWVCWSNAHLSQGEVHRVLYLQGGGVIIDESRVGGRAFLCTWLESLACCFSDCTVCRNHLQILIQEVGVKVYGFLSPKCLLCPREHTRMWLFSGVPFTKGRSCPLSQIGHVCVSVAGTSHLAVTLQRDLGVTVSSKEALKQILSVALTHFLHHRDQIKILWVQPWEG